MSRLPRRRRAPVKWILVLPLLAHGCGAGTGPHRPLAMGTWGGDNAAVLVQDTVVHVHIGCTSGNAPPPPPETMSDGHFELTGLYTVDAHPVNLGIYHPARITGTVSGRWMQITVTLLDTAVTLGPVVLFFGRVPAMQQCPICRPPGARQ